MFYSFIKRVFDLIVAIVGVIILVPISLIIKIANVFTGDFHSIFFVQERIGKGGKKFKLLKFRSMRVDASEELSKMMKEEKYRKQWRDYQKIDDDPRITKVGRIIRKGSIDEIPQFLNVLFGQMSLVGPRPLIPGELKLHRGDAKKYYSVKPGITGYWATRGRSNIDYEDRLKMEYYYIENRGILLDLKIIARTFATVLRSGNAK